MELRHLRYFVALADARHFTRAAKALGIAQPALSQQIRRLEGEIGLELVARSTRSVTLTQAGEALAAGARRVLRDVDRLGDELAAIRGVQTGRLVVGVTRTPGAVDVAAALAAFHHGYPGVDLDVREGLSVDLLRGLRSGELDIAVVAEGPALDARVIDLRTVASEPLVAIVPPAHDLGARGALDVRDLLGERIVTFHRGATIREQLEDAAARHDAVLRVAFETADVRRAREIVAHGLAVGVLPASDAGAPGPGVVAIPLGGRGIVHRTAVATVGDREPSPAARALQAILVEASVAAVHHVTHGGEDRP